uniref:Uncharacterized protein n=1 Tax=Romanomermis culicivorax TaxID=13658 RepID=A0A915KSL1_ROMCU
METLPTEVLHNKDDVKHVILPLNKSDTCTVLTIGVCAGSRSRFPPAFPAFPLRDAGGNGMTFLKAGRERAGL